MNRKMEKLVIYPFSLVIYPDLLQEKSSLNIVET